MSRCSYLTISDAHQRDLPNRNVRIGKAEIVYCHARKAWQLPGGLFTRDEDVAYDYAFRMHDLLKANA